MLYNIVRRSGTSRQASVTFRDFSGGLSVADSPYNLSYKYCTELENMLVDVDGGIVARNGVQVLCNLDAYSPHIPQTDYSVQVSIDETSITAQVLWPVHGLSSGQSINIVSVSDTVAGFTLGGVYVITRIDDDKFSIELPLAATESEVAEIVLTIDYYEPWDFQDGDIVHVHYFQSHIITFLSSGIVVAIDGLGIPRVIFSSTIAKTLPGAPSGWGQVDYVSTTVGGGELVATTSGLDKKIVIDLTATLPVQYLHDRATGSNLNVPIGAYVHRVGQYLCCSTTGGEIALSARSTNGTFPGDPDPNNATTYNIAGYSAESNEVIGLSQFRGRLIVGLSDVSLAIALDGFDDEGNHIPEVGEDVFTGFGIISHKSLIAVGNELLFADNTAINAMSVAITKTFIPKNVSGVVQKLYASKIRNLSIGTAKYRMFAVRYPRINAYIVFVPDSDACTTYTGFVYYNNAWSLMTGINPVAGCSTLLKDLVLCDRRRVCVMSEDDTFTDFGNDHNAIWEYTTLVDPGMKVRSRAALASYRYIGTQSLQVSGMFNPVDPLLWEPVVGDPIDVAMRSPWIDLSKRTTMKHLRRIGLDTEGAAEFNFKVFGDRVSDPLVDINFVATDHRGFGIHDQPYGGGRTNWDARLWGVAGQCDTFSWLVSGAITKRLKIVAVMAVVIAGAR